MDLQTCVSVHFGPFQESVIKVMLLGPQFSDIEDAFSNAMSSRYFTTHHLCSFLLYEQFFEPIVSTKTSALSSSTF